MKKRLVSLLQLLLGITVIFWLLWGINKTSVLATFSTGSLSAEPGTLYVWSEGDPETDVHFVVRETQKTENGNVISAIRTSGNADNLPESGTLNIERGTGPAELEWESVDIRPYGRRLILDTVIATGHRWPFLAAATAGFFIAICLCVLRWRVLLEAIGLKLTFRKTLGMYFVGQFFNSFLPGGLSGDLVKAYYVTRETPAKKTETAATVFIDRIIGLLALVALTVTVMLIRLPFFIDDPTMRMALVFNVMLLAGSIAGTIIVFRKDVFERWRVFRLMEEKTSLGRIINRVYEAFHICFKHPGALPKTLAYSLLNHFLFIGLTTFCLGKALNLSITMLDYFSVFPVVNAVAAIPVTPGGLGTRDAAAIYLLSSLEVPEASALVLSLLVYCVLLFWSLAGGIVYIFGPRKPDIKPSS
mgnify:CR=1 FL=1